MYSEKPAEEKTQLAFIGSSCWVKLDLEWSVRKIRETFLNCCSADNTNDRDGVGKGAVSARRVGVSRGAFWERKRHQIRRQVQTGANCCSVTSKTKTIELSMHVAHSKAFENGRKWVFFSGARIQLNVD